MKFSIFTLLSYTLSLTFLMIGSLDTVGAIGFSDAIPQFLKIPFLDFPSLFVVLGGVMTGLFIMYPTPAVLNAVASIRHVFSHYEGKTDMVEAQIQTILEYRKDYAADKNGFVERVKSKTSDVTTRYMFDLVSTNYSTREMRDMAELYLDKRLTIEHQKADVLSMMASTAPAFGMFGTILGLIMMLKDLSDPASVGVGLSLALLTTLYGVAFANLLFSPMAKKLNTTWELLRQESR